MQTGRPNARLNVTKRGGIKWIDRMCHPSTSGLAQAKPTAHTTYTSSVSARYAIKMYCVYGNSSPRCGALQWEHGGAPLLGIEGPCSTVINPRRACAARVTVLGSVCVSVCLSVKSHLSYGASVRPENAVTYSAGNEGQKICGDLPETTAFKSYAAKHERKSQYANFQTYPRSAFSA